MAKPGDKVAARVKSSDGEENWILAEVVSYSTSTNKYEVDDIDAEEGKEWVKTLYSEVSLKRLGTVRISGLNSKSRLNIETFFYIE